MTKEKQKCSEIVWPAGAFRGHQCHNSAKIQRDGKWFCGTHDPVAVIEKRDKKNAEFRAEVAARQKLQSEAAAKRNEQERRAACFPELLEALKLALQALEAIGDEMTVGERYTNAGQYLLDSLNPARAAIAKAEGEHQ
jgi:uncharacterized Zn finger protein (UPF0148 family)